MTHLVIDTDVFSYLLKGDTRSVPFRRAMVGKRLYLSFMTVAELDRWMLSRGWSSERQAMLEAYLSRFTVIPPDRALGKTWASVTEHRRKAGRPIQCADAWIAATAVLHGVPLLTHNVKDYQGVPGLELVSP